MREGNLGLKPEEIIVLVALYKACEGKKKLNVSVEAVFRRISRRKVMEYRLTKGKVERILNRLVRRGLAMRKGGRRANGTYSITTQGAIVAAKIIEEYT